jgi:hypothetical protein
MNQFARFIIKRSNGLPTVPATPDHRDGRWLITDIYEGELYMNLDDGKLYTRYGNDIYEITTTLVIVS